MIFLFLILIVASFLRLYLLDKVPPGLYSDEAMNGNNAREATRNFDISTFQGGDFKVFYPENNGREGLFINLIGLISQIGAIGLIGPIAVIRLPAAIFGILTVLGVYFLTKELLGKEGSNLQKLNYVALLAAFLLATSFWHVNFSRVGFRAIMAPAFLTWGLYLLLLSFRKIASLQKSLFEKSQITNYKHQTNPKSQIKKVWNSVGGVWCLPVLAGLVYGAGIHSYIAYRATPLLIIFSLWLLAFRYGWKRTLKIGAIFTAAAIIVFLPLGIYFLKNPADFFGRTSQIAVWQSPTPFRDLGLNILKTIGMFNVAGDRNPRHNIPGAPLLWWPVGILFLIGLALGISQLLKTLSAKRHITNKSQISNHKHFGTRNLFGFWNLGFGILLAWLVVTALPVIISNEGIPHALRSILLAPPVFILAAIGGTWLYQKIRSIGHIRLIGLIGFTALITANVYTDYFITWAKNKAVADAFNQKYVQISRQLNFMPHQLPKYVVIDTGGHDVRKIGTPAQTIMYLTDTFLPEKQKEKNIYYLEPQRISEIPSGSFIISL